MALVLFLAFIVVFVILWRKEGEIKSYVDEFLLSNNTKEAYGLLESYQNIIFVEEGWCKDKIRLQDCNETDEFMKLIIEKIGHIDKRWYTIAALVETLIKCAGMGENPLTKYFFTDA